MEKKNEKKEIKTSVWVFWILIAIIGVGLLFTGLQTSVTGTASITTSIMLIVIGIVLLFIGLVMVLGKANVIANDIELPSNEKSTEKENKK